MGWVRDEEKALESKAHDLDEQGMPKGHWVREAKKLADDVTQANQYQDRVREAKRKQMQHSYIPDQGKPKAEYAPYVGIGAPFGYDMPFTKTGTTPPFIPNPGGMFTHAGKMLRELKSGGKQLVGDSDNPYSVETQKMADTYGKADHSTLGQIGGASLMMLPDLAASPFALPATALPFAAMVKPFAGPAGISKLAKEIAAEAAAKPQLFIPGVKGGIEGGLYGSASHVHPESEEPGWERIKAGGVGLVSGALLDAGMSNVKGSFGKTQADLARKQASGDLPKTVDLPGPELWNQRAAAKTAKAYRESGADQAWKPGQKTKRLYEEGYGKALGDIEDNANLLRMDMTGLPRPVNKGESLTEIVNELKIGKVQNRGTANTELDNFLRDKDNHLSMDKDEFYRVANDFNDYIDTNVADLTAHSIKKLRNAVDDTYDKVVGDYIDVKDFMRLRTAIKNVIDDTTPKGTAGKAASKLYRDTTESLDKLEIGKNVWGDEKSYSNFYNAMTAKNKFNDSYYKDLIIRETADGDRSPNEFSDLLFGAKNMQDSKERLSAIDTLLTLSPRYKKSLKRESLQQLLSGQSTKGKNFNIDEFISEYGGGLDTGRGTPTFDKLYSKKEQGQLNDLYNVSRKLEQKQPDVKSKGYAKTSLAAQNMTLNTTPTLTNLLSSPGIDKIAGGPLGEYLQAIRYVRGRKQGLSPNLLPGKAGGMASGSMMGETTDERNNPSPPSSLDHLLKLLGTFATN